MRQDDISLKIGPILNHKIFFYLQSALQFRCDVRVYMHVVDGIHCTLVTCILEENTVAWVVCSHCSPGYYVFMPYNLYYMYFLNTHLST